MRRVVLLAASHLLVACLGFALGIYLLPILVAPDSPAAAQVATAIDGAAYTAAFKRNLKGSDPLHWGEGRVGVSPTQIAFEGKLAPGPDYKVYLTRTFVDNAADFKRIKKDAVRVGEVKTFDRFIAEVPGNVRIDDYTTVVVWCERFSKFISAGQYRRPDRERDSAP